MAITQQELGLRIRAARDACGMTQDEVGKHLELSRPTIVQIEAGNRSVSSLELSKLAHLFGRDLREFVAESFAEDQDALAALFRADAEVAGQPAVMARLRECMAIGREITTLERLVGVDRDLMTAATYQLPTPASRWEAIQQGMRVAEEERRRLGLGAGPLPPLTELLESQGVRAGLVELPDDVSGLTMSDRQAGLLVVANREHHPLRRRFSFAHEYAHVLVDRSNFGLVSRTSDRSALLEVRANSFAACFLMPEDGVRQVVSALGKGKPSRAYAEVFDEAGSVNVEGRAEPGSQTVQIYDVVQVAHHFGVSRLAALFRLRNLRLITEAEFELLRTATKRDGASKMAGLLGLPEPEQEEVRNEFRQRLLSLGLEAFRREEISRGKLAELAAMVGLSHREMESLLEDADPGPDADT